MTRERAFGWVSSVALQVLALGALGVSPLLNYDGLPKPHNAIPLANYVRVIETPKAPVAPQRATDGAAPNPVPRATAFMFSSVILNEIPPETAFFPEATEGVPLGISLGIPGSVGEAPVEIREPEPLRVSRVTAPRKRHHVNPSYPTLAAQARVQGTVELEATIDESGNVVDLRVLRSIPLLDAAALEAVRLWKYDPTLLNGSPVPILMSVSVRFELGR